MAMCSSQWGVVRAVNHLPKKTQWIGEHLWEAGVVGVGGEGVGDLLVVALSELAGR